MAAFKPRRPRTNVTPLPRPFRRNQSGADNVAGDFARRTAASAEKPRHYLLPNAFTTAALFGGFFAIVQAMNLRFEAAAIAIFASMVLDGMDGRVARMTHSQSAFGEQYDSLSDMGVVRRRAGARHVRMGAQGPGVAGAGSPPSFTALARHCAWRASIPISVRSTSVSSRACPVRPAAGAGLPVLCGWRSINRVPVNLVWLPWVAFFLTVYAGVTMVSNAPFYSGKALDVRHRVPFAGVLLVVMVFGAGFVRSPRDVVRLVRPVWHVRLYFLGAIACCADGPIRHAAQSVTTDSATLNPLRSIRDDPIRHTGEDRYPLSRRATWQIS